ncbi:energy transducer TonB family protein [Telluria aromaticivorans]|uniref:Energy transducer TonB n=1 Tax=Telluria aromaticivorans TaxID=2725995 RepID=A0A7Y2K197_9BURK|nr:energy transducer TonB [Telluria aromaticivorans]NNG24711.1 energy transducer TonB [Telluria aromaticivorans]
MNIPLGNKARPPILPTALLAVLCGCAGPPPPDAAPESRVTVIVAPLPAAAPVPPPSLTLEAYKASVARRIVDRNADRIFSGQLPPMLPAIVVVNITVDKEGQLTDVQVQRSRDPEASQVALASMRRSGPLPRPDGLLVRNSSAMTFSETFLFDASYRFQLRSLAGPQE